ncbi:hypothetical protein Vse01_55780 [Micromonospora sediminimaris]|uniref:Uncharacterized protein n=1 Tax=Micromonospora sediminimaris TaxID=547162 RepID=A0A9W5UXD6_9ACTN|nr:hypothetical protein Vse01_55780 [Micromonospora sediminimaris]
MPGRVATLATCSSDRSAAGSGSRDRDAKTTPGTRIGSRRSIRNRYGDSSTTSIEGSYPPSPQLHLALPTIAHGRAGQSLRYVERRPSFASPDGS